jgi:DNA-binding NarL/FixJ family response regulator
VTRVLVADDHPPIRRGVRRSLEAAGFEVCAEAADGRAAVERALELRPDICLLDVHMPRLGGIDAAAEISESLPETAIVMLTVSDDDVDVLDALRFGAVGYLLKDMNPDRLPAALEGVLAGEAALPRTLTARLVQEFAQRERRRRAPLLKSRGDALSAREREVLDLLGEDLSTAEIGARLRLSPVTVRRHISSLVRKLGVEDRDDVRGLVDPET